MKALAKLCAWMVIFAVFLSACAPVSQQADVAEKCYLYEGEGCGSDFTIHFYDDGTFYYYEGVFSSYWGYGNWVQYGDVLEISDHEFERINYFRVEDGVLIFQAEGSDNFLYVQVEDGERFCENGAANRDVKIEIIN